MLAIAKKLRCQNSRRCKRLAYDMIFNHHTCSVIELELFLFTRSIKYKKLKQFSSNLGVSVMKRWSLYGSHFRLGRAFDPEDTADHVEDDDGSHGGEDDGWPTGAVLLWATHKHLVRVLSLSLIARGGGCSGGGSSTWRSCCYYRGRRSNITECKVWKN